MKHTIDGFSQAGLVELGLNHTHAVLLRWFVDFQNGRGMKSILVEGEKYYWVDYNYVSRELPILGLKNSEVMARRWREMCKCGLMFSHVIRNKQRGNRVYFRLNPDVYDALVTGSESLEAHDQPTNESVDRTTSLLNSRLVSRKIGQKQPKTHDQPTNESVDRTTSLLISRDRYKSYSSYSVIVTEAQKNKSFIQAFNDFCTDDSEQYRNDTAHWIFEHAQKNSNSLGDIINALNICCEKSKQGHLAYLNGILDNKAKAREHGIRPFGKPDNIRISEYLQERLSGHRDMLVDPHYVATTSTLEYRVKSPEDAPAIREMLEGIVVPDVENHTGIKIKIREVA